MLVSVMPSNDNTSNRGLASADEETRERVARAGGEASHGGGRGSSDSSESTHEKKAEAGRKGGEASHGSR